MKRSESEVTEEMNRPHKLLTSSIGKKALMALTGLIWCLYLAGHLFGNLFFYAGPRAFNGYARALESSILLLPIELFLAVTLALHILFSCAVTIENRRARPQRYAGNVGKGGRTVASSTMLYSGVVILIFVIIHLGNFRFNVRETAEASGRDLYSLEVGLFRNPAYALGYVVAACIVGLHVSHGFQSSFRSLGLDHPRYTPTIRSLSRLFGLVVAVGFSSLPIWVYLFMKS